MATVEQANLSPQKKKKSKKRKEKERPLSSEEEENVGDVESTTLENSTGVDFVEPRYEVPAQYKLVDSGGHPDAGSFGKDKELWLIQVPSDFDPLLLNKQQIVIGGRQTLRSDMSTEKAGSLPCSFEVQSRHAEKKSRPSCQLLSAVGNTGQYEARGTFDGTMKIVRSIQVPPLPPTTLGSPERHKSRSLPEGLRARYIPFGSEDPFEVTEIASLLKRKKKERERSQKKKKKKKKMKDNAG